MDKIVLVRKSQSLCLVDENSQTFITEHFANVLYAIANHYALHQDTPIFNKLQCELLTKGHDIQLQLTCLVSSEVE